MSTTPPTINSTLDQLACYASQQLRKILVNSARETGGHYSYVNYAFGAERLHEMYGSENLEELRCLKSLYDPCNQFSFYAPLSGYRGGALQAPTKSEIRDEP